MVELISEFSGAGPAVQCHDFGTNGHGGKIGNQPFSLVLHQDCETVAPLNTYCKEALGMSTHHREEGCICVTPLAIDDEVAGTIPCRYLVKQVRCRTA